jgi:hypothetical protein
MSGYIMCTCRDCFEIGIDGMCWECEEAGCDLDSECQRLEAYGWEKLSECDPKGGG